MSWKYAAKVGRKRRTGGIEKASTGVLTDVASAHRKGTVPIRAKSTSAGYIRVRSIAGRGNLPRVRMVASGAAMLSHPEGQKRHKEYQGSHDAQDAQRAALAQLLEDKRDPVSEVGDRLSGRARTALRHHPDTVEDAQTIDDIKESDENEIRYEVRQHDVAQPLPVT